MNSTSNQRIASIDILRALTMFFMIFVNDLWSLTNIPDWLGHKEAHEDGLGFADIIFPAFLFIVGLAIPYAIKARKSKGENQTQIFQHILVRTIALVVMGYYMVNLENINGDLSLVGKTTWQVLMTLAFFLIWNNYWNGRAFGKVPDWVMKIIGLAILIFLGYAYQSGTPENPVWMQKHWWGILGLIGWSYGLCSVIYLIIKDNLLWIGVATVIFYLLNAQEFIPMGTEIRLVISASNHACVMSGLLVSILLTHFKNAGKESGLLFALVGFATLLFVFGFGTRPEWGISKIQATPSWTAICSGISTLVFIGLYLISDRGGQTKWAKPLAPAGRSTLTCYLVPYFVYAIFSMTDFRWPEFLANGYVGLIKSLVFSYLIIYMTGLLDKWFKIRLSL